MNYNRIEEARAEAEVVVRAAMHKLADTINEELRNGAVRDLDFAVILKLAKQYEPACQRGLVSVLICGTDVTLDLHL